MFFIKKLLLLLLGVLLFISSGCCCCKIFQNENDISKSEFKVEDFYGTWFRGNCSMEELGRVVIGKDIFHWTGNIECGRCMIDFNVTSMKIIGKRKLKITSKGYKIYDILEKKIGEGTEAVEMEYWYDEEGNFVGKEGKYVKRFYY